MEDSNSYLNRTPFHHSMVLLVVVIQPSYHENDASQVCGKAEIQRDLFSNQLIFVGVFYIFNQFFDYL